MKHSPSKLLQFHKHRPWELPTDSWKFYQEWNRALFLHWQVDKDSLASLVPNDLTIDTYEGKAWVSLVAFSMNKVRPRNLPTVSFLSDFDEINLRTYVQFKKKQGVYFLSIEAASKSACKVANFLSELPYRHSNIKRTDASFQSFNPQSNDQLQLHFKIGDLISSKQPIDKWLTERYALFQETSKNINQFEIHHLEWKLRTLKLIELQLHYPKFSQLIDRMPDCCHYSEGVQVLAWRKKITKRQNYG